MAAAWIKKKAFSRRIKKQKNRERKGKKVKKGKETGVRDPQARTVSLQVMYAAPSSHRRIVRALLSSLPLERTSPFLSSLDFRAKMQSTD